MQLKIHPDTPSPRKTEKAVDLLRDGGIIIYPTDTIYGLGCDINNAKAVEKILWMKGLEPKDAKLSFICHDISEASEYAKIDDDAFKIMKKNLPGPFTFILPASNKVPKFSQSRPKTVGIRIPDNNIPLKLVEELGAPIISTSLHHQDKILEYPTDPELIYDEYKSDVDAVIDGGAGSNNPSTVVDLTSGEPVILREGKGTLAL